MAPAPDNQKADVKQRRLSVQDGCLKGVPQKMLGLDQLDTSQAFKSPRRGREPRDCQLHNRAHSAPAR